MQALSEKEIDRATGAQAGASRQYGAALNDAMARFEINTPIRAAAFLATVAIESARLTAVEEGLYYKDPARLLRIYPRAFKTLDEASKLTRNPAALSKLLYRGYHGRGLIQLTWEDNYRAAGLALGFDYVTFPELLVQPKHAALTAAWYWASNGCNAAADKGDMREVTKLVNGAALMHLAERTQQYAENMRWMA